MRETPTWRIPIGVLGLLFALCVYGLLTARYLPPVIGGWHVLLQTPIYLALGVIWILPLKRFLIWMETGRWG